MKLIIVPLIVVAFVLSPFIFAQLSELPERIKIDGRFGDWSGLVEASDSPESASFNPNVDVVDFWVDSRLMELSLYLKVDGEMLVGEPGGERHVDTAFIFIDKDQSPDSGYYIKGIGADFMAEIYGWEGEVIGSTLYSYENDLQDWNLWKREGGIGVAVGVSELEAQVPYESLNMRESDTVDVLFYMQSWDGFEDFSDYVISNEKGILTLKQQGVGEPVISGDSNRLLRLELEAKNADITLVELKVERTGRGTDNEIEDVWLENENAHILAFGTLDNGIATFRPDMELTQGRSATLYVVVEISNRAVAGNSIGFKISNNYDIMTDVGTVSLERIKPQEQRYESSYVLSVPLNVTIDGAFADWEDKQIRNDTSSDIGRDDLDILTYGVSNTNYGPAFFLKVDGEIAGGVKVPYWNSNVKPEPITGGEISHGGIPPEIPPKTGENVVYVFIDTIPGSGYTRQLPIGADYMIEVVGRHNMVQSGLYYEWSGTSPMDWAWSAQGPVEVGLDTVEMEISVPWDDIGVNSENDTFEVYFLATDWKKSGSDYSDGEGVILGTRGTRAETMVEVVNGTGSVANDRFGWNVSYAGDVNDDGYPDIIIGAPYNDTSDGSKTDAGAAYIFFGYSNIRSFDIKASNANVTIYGESAGDYFGWSVSDLGNVDSDTKDDVIIGAPGAGSGKAYIFYGRASWSASYVASSADVIITGKRYGDKFGFSVSGAQDTDSSNYNDILVGAPYYSGLDWWNNSWNNRKRLSFDNSGQTEALVNFPVLVNLSAANFNYSKAKSDGSDLRFIDSDGTTELTYHIEDWDTSGYSYIWVNVTGIDGSSSADHIHMYYNNSAASDVQDVVGTYNSSYVGVWHLNETGTGTRYDATSYDNDGSTNGYDGDEATTGKINGADDFDGNNDYVTMDAVTTDLDSIFTVAFWMKADSTSDSSLVCFHNSGGGNIWRIEMIADNAAIEDNGGSVVISDGEWHYIVGVSDGSKSIIYVDGELDLDNIPETPNLIDSDLASMGQEYDAGPNPGEFFDGILDEVRISDIVRSGDWIKAQYLSMENSFITYGDEEEGKRGRVYLFLGDGSIPTSAESADRKMMGEFGGDQFGFSISNAGDVDNDGKDDVIIGAPYNNDNGTDAGKAYIFYFSDVYNYVNSNTTTKGFITNFNSAKNASDSGAYATLKEEGYKVFFEIFNEIFAATANPWDGTGQDESWTIVNCSDIRVSAKGGAPSGSPAAHWNEAPFGFATPETDEIFYAAIDLSEYTDVKIEYYWQTDDVDLGEGFRAAYSTDSTDGVGGTWTQMYEHLNPTDDTWFRDGPYSLPDVDASSGFMLRFCADFNHANTENIWIDDIKITGNKTYYEMDIEFNTTDVPLIDENYLQLNYSVDGSETDFGVLVYNGSAGDWDDMSAQGDLSATSFTLKEYTLAEDHILGPGYVRTRFIGRNETIDLVNSTLNIEYLRVKSVAGSYELIGESANDNFGWSVGNVSDINEDGSYDDVIVGAPGYSNNKGRAYVFHGGDPFNGTADVILTGENNQDKFGYSVSCAGDIDGDGVSDVIVGVPYWDNGATSDCGAILVYEGGASMDTTADYTYNGTQVNEHFGWSVSFAGDIDGDNFSETLCGAPGYDTQASEIPPSATDAGKAYAHSLFVIPEFTNTLVPITGIMTLFMVLRRKKRKKRGKR